MRRGHERQQELLEAQGRGVQQQARGRAAQQQVFEHGCMGELWSGRAPATTNGMREHGPPCATMPWYDPTGAPWALARASPVRSEVQVTTSRCGILSNRARAMALARGNLA